VQGLIRPTPYTYIPHFLRSSSSGTESTQPREDN
jgi:hypothetical protein